MEKYKRDRYKKKLTALFNTKDVLFVSPFIGHIFHFCYIMSISTNMRTSLMPPYPFICSRCHSKYASKFARKIPPKT
jgi:hypothetical protein